MNRAAAWALEMVVDRILGSWRLESFEQVSPSGEHSFPLGTSPVGLLSYTPEGMMSVHLVAGDDAPPSGMADYTGYFGWFSVARDEAVVRHQIEAASAPGLAGTVQERRYTLSGNKLELSARFNGSAFTLVWKK